MTKTTQKNQVDSLENEGLSKMNHLPDDTHSEGSKPEGANHSSPEKTTEEVKKNGLSGAKIINSKTGKALSFSFNFEIEL